MRAVIFRIAWASAWNRRLPLALMIAAIALSTAILVSTERLRDGLRAGFSDALSGTDLVVGARAHPVQLTLATIFHLGHAAQNVSLAALDRVARLPQVRWLVPIALGDTYRGMPVVATTTDYFKWIRTGESRALNFATGRPFADGLPAAGQYEAVLGATVAERFGLAVGNALALAHGGGAIGEITHDDHPIRVVGVLAASGTPIDRSVLISLEAFEAMHAGWIGGMPPRMGGQGIQANPAATGNPRPREARRPASVTAALVGLQSRAQVFNVQRRLEQPGPEPLTAALPGVALDELWRLVGRGEDLLRLMGALVGLTAIAGLVATILSGLEARRRELAVLRALGAAPRTLFALVLTESSIASAMGVALGLAASAIGMGLLAPWLRAGFGIELMSSWLTPHQFMLIALVYFSALLASLLPAWRAMRLTLADGLSPAH
jgi:putative ABC transport system permease protein